MRPAQVLRRSADYLSRHGVEGALPTAELLMADVLGADRAALYLRDEPLSTDEAKSFGRALCLRCTGTPTQHITGEQGFRRIRLEVRPGVFIPRPETEVLVDIALATIDDVPAPIVVDVGTGSGAIALAIADERPSARVWATDRSSAAVRLARSNARRLGLDVDIREGDLLSPLPPDLQASMDLVVSNPPYLSGQEYVDLPTVVRAEPASALLGGVEVYGRLATEAGGWLRPGGALAVEIGEAIGQEVGDRFAAAGFGRIEVHADLNGRDRVVLARRR